MIPAPKLAVLVPCTQCVNCPVRLTLSLCWPCWPVFGFTGVSTGVPLVTVKPLVSVTTSPPVVSVTLRAPVAAAGSMFSTAVAVVAELMVSVRHRDPCAETGCGGALHPVRELARQVDTLTLLPLLACVRIHQRQHRRSVGHGEAVGQRDHFPTRGHRHVARAVGRCRVDVQHRRRSGRRVDRSSVATVIPAPKLAVVVPCTQCVNCPVRLTLSLCWPCWPVFGFTSVSTGVPLVTVKPLVSVTTSPPVVTVTLRAPLAAAGSMFSTAVAVVAELMVSVATVIPAPKLAVVVPCTQCVNCPVRLTLSPCCPCWPVFGFTGVSTGVPLVTVKPLVSVTTSPPVVTVTLRAPLAAAGSMFSTAVAVVAELTVKVRHRDPCPETGRAGPLHPVRELPRQVDTLTLLSLLACVWIHQRQHRRSVGHGEAVGQRDHFPARRHRHVARAVGRCRVDVQHRRGAWSPS